MKKLVFILVLWSVLFQFNLVTAQDTPERDIELIGILCAINNAQEVNLWASVWQEIDPLTVSETLYYYGERLAYGTIGENTSPKQAEFVLQHAYVWWFYGFALKHPSQLDYAVNFYNYHRQQIYAWAETYNIPQKLCDNVWNSDFLNIDDPRGGYLPGVPTFDDWFPPTTIAFGES